MALKVIECYASLQTKHRLEFFSVMSCSEGTPLGQTHDNYPKELVLLL